MPNFENPPAGPPGAEGTNDSAAKRQKRKSLRTWFGLGASAALGGVLGCGGLGVAEKDKDKPIAFGDRGKAKTEEKQQITESPRLWYLGMSATGSNFVAYIEKERLKINTKADAAEFKNKVADGLKIFERIAQKNGATDKEKKEFDRMRALAAVLTGELKMRFEDAGVKPAPSTGGETVSRDVTDSTTNEAARRAWAEQNPHLTDSSRWSQIVLDTACKEKDLLKTFADAKVFLDRHMRPWSKVVEMMGKGERVQRMSPSGEYFSYEGKATSADNKRVSENARLMQDTIDEVGKKFGIDVRGNLDRLSQIADTYAHTAEMLGDDDSYAAKILNKK